MKVAVEKQEDYKVTLSIEVEAAELDKACERACKKIGAKVTVPGFRKGKAPRKLLERHVGVAYVMQEAFDDIYPKVFQEALKEQDLEPVTRPAVEVETLEAGKDLAFKVSFTRRPDVTLGEYKGLSIPLKVAEVKDEDVEKQLKTFRQRQGKMIEVPEAEAVVADGDLTTLDFTGFIDGKTFEGGEGADYPLQIGSGSFIPGFEEGLIGAKVGEEREVNVTFPADYHSKDVAGKNATFKCTVRSLKKMELPPLDDELAKAVSKFNTLEELRADIRKNLEETAKRQGEIEQHTAAIDKATENITVDIPDVMIDNRVTLMIQEMAMRAEQQGMTLEHYLRYAGLDIARVRTEYREAAEKNVRTDLMLEAVAKAEGITVEPKDLDAEVYAMAVSYGTTPKQIQKIIKDNGQIGDLGRTVLHKKAAQFIYDNLATE